MNRTAKVMLGCMTAVMCAPWAVAQLDNFPPSIEPIYWEVSSLDGQTTVVFDENDAALNDPARIAAFTHQELDVVLAQFRITDADWTIALVELNTEVVAAGEAPPEPPDYEDVFASMRAFGAFGPPDGPPIPQLFKTVSIFVPEANTTFTFSSNENMGEFFGASEESGITPTQDFRYGATPPPAAILTIQFAIPEFIGRSQSRLDPENPIDYDVAYLLRFSVSNESDPEVDAFGFSLSADINSISQFIFVIENPILADPNPPPFAEATSDRSIVAAGTSVLLDASRTFDGFNVGFGAGTPRVFERDDLEFSWEWISGPTRVDPVQTGVHDPLATVTLNVPTPDDGSDPYVFRVTVDDGKGGLPSNATVAIEVRENIPINNPPSSIITGPADPVTVGSLITLNGSQSADVDGDPLTYRWRQISELGETLTIDELRIAFQPISGLATSISTWQAVEPGTFYFRLLVNDGQFVTASTFSIEVIEAATAGVVDNNAGVAADESAGSVFDSLAPIVPACGAGLVPLAIVPLALVGWRRRHR